MCACAYMYIHMYIYIYTYTCVFIYMCIHTYVSLYFYLFVYPSIRLSFCHSLSLSHISTQDLESTRPGVGPVQAFVSFSLAQMVERGLSILGLVRAQASHHEASWHPARRPGSSLKHVFVTKKTRGLAQLLKVWCGATQATEDKHLWTSRPGCGTA